MLVLQTCFNTTKQCWYGWENDKCSICFFLVGLNPSPQSLQKLDSNEEQIGKRSTKAKPNNDRPWKFTLSIAQRSPLDAIGQLTQCKLLIMSLMVALVKRSTICTTSMAKHLFLGKAHSILLKIQISWMLDRNHQKDNHSFHSTSTNSRT